MKGVARLLAVLASLVAGPAMADDPPQGGSRPVVEWHIRSYITDADHHPVTFSDYGNKTDFADSASCLKALAKPDKDLADTRRSFEAAVKATLARQVHFDWTCIPALKGSGPAAGKPLPKPQDI